MEVSTDDVDRSHVRIGDGDAFWIGVGVKFAVDLETGVGGGGADHVDDDASADQRLGAPPPDCDPGGEPAMLDFIPLAGAGRQVVDDNFDAKLIGETLQFAFPQAQARAVAAAPS